MQKTVTVALLTSALAVSACTSSLKPLTASDYDDNCVGAAMPDVSTGAAGFQDRSVDTRLTYSICQANKKTEELNKAYSEWYNDPAIFDLPLIGLAATAAGLLLFEAHPDAIAATALAAGGVAVGSEYANSQGVRDALLDGSRGYACLADNGYRVLTKLPKVSNHRTKMGSLDEKVRRLEIALAGPNPGNDFKDLLPRAQRAAKSGRETVEHTQEELDAADKADVAFREAARTLSDGLLDRVKRNQVDFSSVFQSLSAKAAAASQSQVPAGGGSAPPPQVTSKATKDLTEQELVELVEYEAARLMMALPGFKELNAEFGVCAAKHITGS